VSYYFPYFEFDLTIHLYDCILRRSVIIFDDLFKLTWPFHIIFGSTECKWVSILLRSRSDHPQGVRSFWCFREVDLNIWCFRPSLVCMWSPCIFWSRNLTSLFVFAESTRLCWYHRELTRLFHNVYCQIVSIGFIYFWERTDSVLL
jgi:hypothetical protein